MSIENGFTFTVNGDTYNFSYNRLLVTYIEGSCRHRKRTMDKTFSLKTNLDHAVYRLINNVSEGAFRDKAFLQMAIHAEIIAFCRLAKNEGFPNALQQIMPQFPGCYTTKDMALMYVNDNY